MKGIKNEFNEWINLINKSNGNIILVVLLLSWFVSEIEFNFWIFCYYKF